MNVIGIVVEYNPFHNGHLYQLKKIKEKYKDSLVIACMSSSFTQRGNTSILNKWEKTFIALNYGVDLVVELPFPFSTQSADIFAYGSIKLLNELKIDTLIFGSESNDIDKLFKVARVQISNKEFDNLVKKYLDKGINYPTALNKAVKKITGYEVNEANDLLGVSYIKEIIKNNYKIKIETIKRTNSFHDKNLEDDIVSASNIREKLLLNKNVEKYVPKLCYKYLKDKNVENNYFDYLKYKIISNINNLDKYQTVDEGIENRIKKYIYESSSLDELINKVKTKRYTYNKIYRMFTHILTDFTKEKAFSFKELEYIRVLGFTIKGKKFLRNIKPTTNLPIITNYSNKYKMLEYEQNITSIYNIINNEEIVLEYKVKPIIKE